MVNILNIYISGNYLKYSWIITNYLMFASFANKLFVFLFFLFSFSNIFKNNSVHIDRKHELLRIALAMRSYLVRMKYVYKTKIISYFTLSINLSLNFGISVKMHCWYGTVVLSDWASFARVSAIMIFKTITKLSKQSLLYDRFIDRTIVKRWHQTLLNLDPCIFSVIYHRCVNNFQWTKASTWWEEDHVLVY